MDRDSYNEFFNKYINTLTATYSKHITTFW